MAEQEKKPEGQQPTPPVGSEQPTPPAPNPSPSVEELQKQIQELQNQSKEKDTKISDLESTNATIAQRQRQIAEEHAKVSGDKELTERIRKINERRTYDPDGADAEMASLLTEVKTQAAKEAATQAQSSIGLQNTIEKLKQGVKSANPEFSDTIVDVVMERANSLAASGKYKSASDAVSAATQLVKSELDGYVSKKNAVPPLPPGAGAEGGPNKPPDPAPQPEKTLSPLEELEARKSGQQKKIL